MHVRSLHSSLILKNFSFSFTYTSIFFSGPCGPLGSPGPSSTGPSCWVFLLGLRAKVRTQLQCLDKLGDMRRKLTMEWHQHALAWRVYKQLAKLSLPTLFMDLSE